MFFFYNPNECGLNTGDCVIRALCKATGLDWQDIYVELCVMGYAMCDWGNANRVWGQWLLDHEYTRRSIPDSCPMCYTIGEFAAEHPSGTYLVCTGSHVACIIDGNLYDSWNSSGETAIYYFVKE